MPASISRIGVFIVVLTTPFALAAPEVTHYGNFKHMVHKKQTAGVVELKEVLTKKNTYALGAIEKGTGEILTMDGKTWLDYGADGIGNASTAIPTEQKAVILAKTEVEQWQTIYLSSELNKQQLRSKILELAKSQGIDTDKPFPFLLEGTFLFLEIHVINGINPKFSGHGGQQFLYLRTTQQRQNQTAKILGFYSANIQGVYTHMEDSWHLHALIDDPNSKELSATHVDDIHINNEIKLLLPSSSTIKRF